MADDVIRYTWSVPELANDPKLVAHMEQNAQRLFADALFEWVSTHNGAIVGPIHYRDETVSDFLDWTTKIETHTMYCHVTALPEPPTYRLLGGPADGRLVRTNGEHIWRVPLAPPMPSVINYADPPERVRARYAEYERIEGTATYRYAGTRDD